MQLQETKGRFDDLVGMTGIVGAFKTTDTLTHKRGEGIMRKIAQGFVALSEFQELKKNLAAKIEHLTNASMDKVDNVK